MKRYIFNSLCLICFLHCNFLLGLNRDYGDLNDFCSSHIENDLSYHCEWIEEYLPIIPTTSEQCVHVDCKVCHNASINEYEDEDGRMTSIEEYWTCDCIDKNYSGDYYMWMPSWVRCTKQGIYAGYLDNSFRKYNSCLRDFLQWYEQNQQCYYFWPELSSEARKINDKAYHLFKELIETTSLCEEFFGSNQRKNLMEFFWIGQYGQEFSIHEIACFFVSHGFFYSHYDKICSDIEFYVQNHFQGREKQRLEIYDKIADIRETLAKMFLDLYNNCLKVYSSERIEQERFIVQAMFDPFCLYEEKTYTNTQTPKFSFSLEMSATPSTITKQLDNNNSNITDFFLTMGTRLNELMLYEAAIGYLNKAIALQPKNKEAYLERAISYFETNQLDLAIQDCQTAKSLTLTPPFAKFGLVFKTDPLFVPQQIPFENRIEFSKGLLIGFVGGGKDFAIEVIPSLISGGQAACSGVWAFVCSPNEVSQEFIQSCCTFVHFLKNNTTLDALKVVVPEIADLCKTWDLCNDYTRGEKIGYIIGRYGLDVFGPIAAFKTLKSYHHLRRMNALLTIEKCSLNQANRAIIFEKIAQRKPTSKPFFSFFSKPTIQINNPNVVYHVMQEKHAWDKLIPLTGDKIKDFQKVLQLLEENSILTEKYFVTSEKFLHDKIIRSDYKKIVNGYEVHAVFETHVNTNETFLKNAWIVTK